MILSPPSPTNLAASALSNNSNCLTLTLTNQVPKDAIEEITKAFKFLFEKLVEKVMPNLVEQSTMFAEMCKLPEWGICTSDDCDECTGVVGKLGDMLNPFVQSGEAASDAVVPEVQLVQVMTYGVHKNEGALLGRLPQEDRQQLVQDDGDEDDTLDWVISGDKTEMPFVTAMLAECKQAGPTCKACRLLLESDKKIQWALAKGTQFFSEKSSLHFSIDSCEISFSGTAILGGAPIPMTGTLSADDEVITIQGSSTGGAVPLVYPVSISDIDLMVMLDSKNKTVLTAAASSRVAVSVAGKVSSAGLDFFWGGDDAVHAIGSLEIEQFDVIPGVLRVNKGIMELEYSKGQIDISLVTSGSLQLVKGGAEVPHNVKLSP